MPNVVSAKTELAPKHYPLVTLTLFVFFSVVASLIWNEPTCYYHYGNNRQLQRIGQTIKLEEASTIGQLQQGLSNRPCIASNQGMLFVFDKPGKYPFWMKDMHFPLDIIWVDSQHKVINIQPNVLPSSYPKTYSSSKPAQFVIELPAGKTAALGITPDTTLMF